MIGRVIDPVECKGGLWVVWAFILVGQIPTTRSVYFSTDDIREGIRIKLIFGRIEIAVIMSITRMIIIMKIITKIISIMAISNTPTTRAKPTSHPRVIATLTIIRRPIICISPPKLVVAAADVFHNLFRKGGGAGYERADQPDKTITVGRVAGRANIVRSRIRGVHQLESPVVGDDAIQRETRLIGAGESEP